MQIIILISVKIIDQDWAQLKREVFDLEFYLFNGYFALCGAVVAAGFWFIVKLMMRRLEPISAN